MGLKLGLNSKMAASETIEARCNDAKCVTHLTPPLQIWMRGIHRRLVEKFIVIKRIEITVILNCQHIAIGITVVAR